MLKATHVDGVYSEDPHKNPAATFYEHLTYNEVLQRELGVMDLGAFSQCREYKMPLRIFNINKPGALLRVVCGANEGTLISS